METIKDILKRLPKEGKTAGILLILAYVFSLFRQTLIALILGIIGAIILFKLLDVTGFAQQIFRLFQ